MSVRSFQEVVPEQVTPTTTAAATIFALTAWLGLHGLNNLYLLATTPVSSSVEWLVTVIATVACFTVALAALKLLDIELEVGS